MHRPTHMLFFTFLHRALCSRNNKYSIGLRHLFLLNSLPAQTAFHHCTFSFITAHFVHHCTLKQALALGNFVPLTLWSLYAGADVLLRSQCSLNFPNLCDNFKKLVSKIRKCRQLSPKAPLRNLHHCS